LLWRFNALVILGIEMIYREEDWVVDVEIISQVPEIIGNADGVKTTLRVTKTIQESLYIKKEALPADGEVFSVWVSNNAGGYGGGWSLSAS
jgi:hypothetical protein